VKCEFGLSIRSSTKDEAPKLIELFSKSFEHPEEFWRWRYLSNPFLDPYLVLAVEKGGKIIGCGYWMPRNLKISSRLTVSSLLAAYVFVDSEHRGKGIGRALLESMRSLRVYEKNKSIVCTALVQDAGLYKDFYRSTTKDVPFCDSTATYYKFLNCSEIKKRVNELNQKLKTRNDLHNQFSKLKLRILFLLRGAPPFVLEMLGAKMSVEENVDSKIEKFHGLVVKGDLSFALSFIDGEKGIGSLIKAMFTGSLVVKARLKDMYAVYRFSKLLRQALRVT